MYTQLECNGVELVLIVCAFETTVIGLLRTSSQRTLGFGFLWSISFRRAHIGSHSPCQISVSSCTEHPSRSSDPAVWKARVHPLHIHPIAMFLNPICSWSSHTSLIEGWVGRLYVPWLHAVLRMLMVWCITVGGSPWSKAVFTWWLRVALTGVGPLAHSDILKDARTSHLVHHSMGICRYPYQSTVSSYAPLVANERGAWMSVLVGAILVLLKLFQCSLCRWSLQALSVFVVVGKCILSVLAAQRRFEWGNLVY
jgi:hypothetical protein